MGVDPHKATHTVEGVNEHEQPVARLQVAADRRQMPRLWGWPNRSMTSVSGAVESVSGRGRLLAQQLVAAGEHVVDVPATLAARVRLLGSISAAKHDPKDALSPAIAITQIAHDTPGRAYYDRKIAEGKSNKDARRARTRRVSDAVWRQLRTDLHHHRIDAGPDHQDDPAKSLVMGGFSRKRPMHPDRPPEKDVTPGLGRAMTGRDDLTGSQAGAGPAGSPVGGAHSGAHDEEKQMPVLSIAASKLASLGLAAKIGVGLTVATASAAGAGAAGVLPDQANVRARDAIEAVTPVEFDTPDSDHGDNFGSVVSSDATGESDGEPGVDGSEISSLAPGAAHRPVDRGQAPAQAGEHPAAPDVPGDAGAAQEPPATTPDAAADAAETAPSTVPEVPGPADAAGNRPG